MLSSLRLVGQILKFIVDFQQFFYSPVHLLLALETEFLLIELRQGRVASPALCIVTESRNAQSILQSLYNL